MKIAITTEATFDKSKIAANIRSERQRAGYSSTAEAAKAFGVSRPTYCKYEDARTVGDISIKKLQDLAELFGCPVERFFMD